MLFFKKLGRKKISSPKVQAYLQKGLSHHFGLSSNLCHFIKFHLLGGFSKKNQKNHQPPDLTQHHRVWNWVQILQCTGPLGHLLQWGISSSFAKLTSAKVSISHFTAGIWTTYRDLNSWVFPLNWLSLWSVSHWNIVCSPTNTVMEGTEYSSFLVPISLGETRDWM